MTDMPYYQAKQNGSVDFSSQPPGPNKEKIVTILSKSLNANGWNLLKDDTSSQPFRFDIEAFDLKLELYIYCWRISNGGRKGRPYEQRIQIGNVNNEGFEINNSSESKKGLLLGIYEVENQFPVIVAWETEKNRSHGASKSCFVDIRAIAKASRDGFVQTRDKDGNIVCAFKEEFLIFYIMNLNKLHLMDIDTYPTDNSIAVEKEFSMEEFLTGGTNKITYGAPGVGKSYSLGEIGKRVTFHPEYTYFEFVGGLKPGKSLEGEITYNFTPGPFLKILKEAYAYPSQMHTLIIEEINRANTAAVFGDIFQLLDRDKKGWSEYSIENEEILTFLNEDRLSRITQVKLPSNLNIFATMNSADQGVFVMDSAFKRRWEFEYIGIKFEGVEHADVKIKYANHSISWANFATTINQYMSIELEINEDKLIGPYFLKEKDLTNNQKIANKLLIYLWDDVVRHQRGDLFLKEYKTFYSLTQDFIKGEKPVFSEDVNQLILRKAIPLPEVRVVNE